MLTDEVARANTCVNDLSSPWWVKRSINMCSTADLHLHTSFPLVSPTCCQDIITVSVYAFKIHQRMANNGSLSFSVDI